jgi:hypothetical protein
LPTCVTTLLQSGGGRKQSEMKKPWEKPKLIILVRGKPAERTLVACKTDGSDSDPQIGYTGCDFPAPDGTGTPPVCNFCNDLDPS